MKCPKCAYERKPNEQAPDYECPSCGVNYAKYTLLLRQRETRENGLPPKLSAPPPPRREKSSGYWSEVAAFRVMAAPALIRVNFWLGLIALIIAGIVFLKRGETLQGLGLLFAAPLGWRLLAEFAILPFSLHESLEAIRKRLDERAGQSD